MDILDKKLVYGLTADGRASLSELAEKIGTSKAVVKYRMERLERQKVIRKYIPVINIFSFGFNSYMVFVQLMQNCGRGIIDKICGMPEITWAARCTGNYDLVFAVYAKNVSDFYRIFSEVSYYFNGSIRKHSVTISMEESPIHLKYLLDKPATEKKFNLVSGDVHDIGKESISILHALDGDGRASIIDLAKKTKLSIDVIRTRMKNMRNNGIILGFTADVDVTKLGMFQYELLINLNHSNKARGNSFFSYLKRHPNIIFFIKCIGEWDVMLRVDAKDNKQFDDILLELKDKFSDMILGYQTLILFDDLKYSFMPPI